MSHMIAISTNSRQQISCMLNQYPEMFKFSQVGKGGFGTGYYKQGELLTRRSPQEPDPDMDLVAELNGLESNIVIAHARDATVGKISGNNTHPFTFQHWMFAHNGTCEGFNQYRNELYNAMPPYIQRGIKGDTDSEHLFHLIMAFLFDAGQINRADINLDIIQKAVSHSVTMVDTYAAQSGHASSKMSLVISDGYSIVALSRGIPVAYALIEGITNCKTCRPSRIPPGNQSEGVNHSDLKGVILKSEVPHPEHSDLCNIEPNSFIAVSSTQHISFSKF